MIEPDALAKLPVERRLEQAVDAALSAADALWEREREYPTILAIAESIYSEHTELMDAAKKPVLLDRLCWLIKRRKAARFDKDFHQLDLPGLELPRTLVLKDGRRPRIDICTAHQMDEAIGVLEARARVRERQGPKLRRLKSARDIMEPYRLENRSITWGDVKRKELQRRDRERREEEERRDLERMFRA